MHYKKTKIIATIGPASENKETIKKLIKLGMNVARLNFSHGNRDDQKRRFDIIKEVSKELNIPVAIVADLPGPKLRLGMMDGIRQIKKYEEVEFSLEAKDTNQIPIQFDLTPFVKKDQRLFLNDGLIALRIHSVKDKIIKAIALNAGIISSNKGINVPDTQIDGVSFTSKDKEDAEFAINMGVDFLALSFVQTIDDLKPAKALIKKLNSQVQIIAKIEREEAVKNLQEIIKLADAVMIARGDLALETKASDVPIIQQKIIRLSRQFQKPVIVATQMLESMMENPRPTRAETSDVGSSVLDQVDSVMLSGETAAGKYPVEALSIMAEIIFSVEKHPDYKHYIKINWENIDQEEIPFSAITSAGASLAFRTKAKVIAVPTVTGKIAKLLSSFRPDAQIVAITHDDKVRAQLNLVWGIQALVVTPVENFDDFIKKMIDKLKENNFVEPEDKVVIITGSTIGISGATDTIKIVTV